MTPGEVTQEKQSLTPEPSQKQFPCNLCHLGYTSRDNLHRHMRSQHKDSIPFGCNSCRRRFFDRGTLAQHTTRVHKKDSLETEKHTTEFSPETKGPQDQVLDFGGFGDHFLLSGSADKAVSDETGVGHSCTVCKKRFRGRQAKSSLKRHMRTHSGEMKYSCSFCKEKFMYSQSCRAHEKSCSGAPKSLNLETTQSSDDTSGSKGPTELKTTEVKKKRPRTSMNLTAISHIKSELVSSNQVTNENNVQQAIKHLVDNPESNQEVEKDNETDESVSECELCPKKPKFKNMKLFTNHIRSSHKLNLQEYKDKVAKNDKQVEYLAESSTFLAACKVCTAILVSKAGLHKHIDEKHGLDLDEYNML